MWNHGRQFPGWRRGGPAQAGTGLPHSAVPPSAMNPFMIRPGRGRKEDQRIQGGRNWLNMQIGMLPDDDQTMEMAEGVAERCARRPEPWAPRPRANQQGEEIVMKCITHPARLMHGRRSSRSRQGAAYERIVLSFPGDLKQPEHLARNRAQDSGAARSATCPVESARS